VGNEWVKDEGNGLMEMGVRFYTNNTGTFMSRDVLIYYGLSVRAYSYARNNPLVIIDPSGFDGYHEGCGGSSPHRHAQGPSGDIMISCAPETSNPCGQQNKAPVAEASPAAVKTGVVAAGAMYIGHLVAAAGGWLLGMVAEAVIDISYHAVAK
jgi:RHS repeat-associated protein